MRAALRLHTDHDAVMACQDNLAFMRPLEPGSMKLIVTSPPANLMIPARPFHGVIWPPPSPTTIASAARTPSN